jgi:hypothetical protein
LGDLQELLGLLSERGVSCKNCKGAEKSHIIAQVAHTRRLLLLLTLLSLFPRQQIHSIHHLLLTLLAFPPATNTRRPTLLHVFPGAQVKESIHLPKKTKEAPASSNSEKKKPDVDDLMSQLKGMPGMENIKVLFALLLTANTAYAPLCNTAYATLTRTLYCLISSLVQVVVLSCSYRLQRR